MDAEWKLALPGAALVYSSPALGIALLLAGIVNLQGDPYQHHGEQWHFMPRKPGAGSETAILWQPGCAMIAEQTCARTIGEIGLDGDMPKRVALAGSQHSSDSGYARAALANLLRWTASVEQRNGRLFTDAEVRDIYAQVLSTAQLLESWQARSFNEFRWEIRRRNVMRFYGKTDLELRASTPMRWSRANAFEPSRAPHCLAHSSACLPRRSGWCHCAASLGSTRSDLTCQSWSHNGVPSKTTRMRNGCRPARHEAPVPLPNARHRM